METIKVNTDELGDSSNKIKGYAEQFDNVLNDISKTLLGLECFWMGQGFFEFQGEFNILNEKMKDVTASIKGIGQDLNNVANQMKQADLQQAGLISKSGLLPSLSDTYQPTSPTANQVTTTGEKVGAVAKTVGLDLTGGILGVVGGVLAIRGGDVSEGSAMLLYGSNSVVSGVADLAYESDGDWGNVGDTNLLLDTMKSLTEKVIPKDFADPFAEAVYLGGNLFSMGGLKGILKSVTDLSKLCTTTTSRGFYNGAYRIISVTKPAVTEAFNYIYAPVSNGFGIKDLVTGADNVKTEIVEAVEKHILKPMGLCENTSSQSVLSTN